MLDKEDHWQAYFARAYQDPLAADFCSLRTQLQDRTSARAKRLFGTSADFNITDISNGVVRNQDIKGPAASPSLDAVLAAELPPKGVRMISLASDWTTSPLRITQPLAARIFERYRVGPEFLRVLLFFGREPLQSEARCSFTSFHKGEDGEIALAYKLNYFEKNSSGVWTSRQIGVYHHQQSRAAGCGSLLIFVSGTPETKFISTLRQLLASPVGAGAPGHTARHLEENPWSLHARLLSCYSDNWRQYFDQLGTQFQKIADRAMAMEKLLVDDNSIGDVQKLRDLHDDSLFGGAACACNVDVARELASQLGGGGENGCPLLLRPFEARSLAVTADMLGGLSSSCTVLQDRIKNATDLVGYLIAFHYQVVMANLEADVAGLAKENRDLTKGLHGLAEDTSKMTEELRKYTQSTADDGGIVSIITLVSAVYLPGSFVASIFGMNFFDFDEQARRISMSTDFWIFVLLWVGMMVLTVAGFAAIYRYNEGGGMSWLRKRLTGRGGSGASPAV
ncbi:hypothetical protein RB601_003686 [Gaeumannomyces tritici]